MTSENPTLDLRSTTKRILDFIRFWLHVRANVTVVLANQGAIAQAFQSQVAIINQLNARVHWYEKRVPLIAKEYLAFKHHEKKLFESAAAEANYAEREARRAADQQQARTLEVVS